MAQGERPDDVAAFYDDMGAQMLELAKKLNGKISVRAFDVKPNEKDKRSWLVTSEDGRKEGIEWLLDSKNGPPAFIEQAKQMLWANAGFLRFAAAHGIDPKNRGIEFFAPDVRSADDVRRFREMLAEAERQLREEGKIVGVLPPLRFGAMFERPMNKDQIRAILAVSDFGSVGTRDLSKKLNVDNPFNARFRRMVKDVVGVAAEFKDKEVHVCGLQSSNDFLITDLHSIPGVPKSALPSFSVFDVDAPRVQEYLRVLNSEPIDELADLITTAGHDFSQGSIEALKDAVRAVRAKRTELLRADPIYKEALHRFQVQAGADMAVQANLEKKGGVVQLTWVKVEGPEGESISNDEAGRVGFDYSFLIPVARMIVEGLKFRGPHPVLQYLNRMAQNFIDREKVFLDPRYEDTFAHVGDRQDIFGLLHPGSTGGVGNASASIIAPSSASDAIAHSVTRVFVKGKIPVVPAGWVLEIEGSSNFSQRDLRAMLQAGSVPGEDGYDIERVKDKAIAIAKRKKITVDRSRLEDDKATAVISLGRKPDCELLIRRKRMSTAAVGAAIRTKLGGEMVAIPVPADGRPFFSDEERANLSMNGINPKKIWTRQTLLPVEREDDVAVAIGLSEGLNDIGWLHAQGVVEDKIPALSIDEDGTITMFMLWFAKGAPKLYKVRFGTNVKDLKDAIAEIEKQKVEMNATEAIDSAVLQQSALAARLAVVWDTLGETSRAQNVMRDWRGRVKANALDKIRWQAVGLYMKAFEAMRGDFRADGSLSTRASATAASIFTLAFQMLMREPELREFAAFMELPVLIRRNHYWLTQQSFGAAYSPAGELKDNNKLADAFRHFAAALNFAEGGYDTRMIGNSMRLKPIVDEYKRWYVQRWASVRVPVHGIARGPSLSEKIRMALQLYFEHGDRLATYQRRLKDSGGHLLLAVLVATALVGESFDTQARILNFLLYDDDGRKILHDLETAQSATVQSVLTKNIPDRIVEIQMRAPDWLLPIPFISIDRIVIRSKLLEVLPKIEAHPKAHQMLQELVRIANAKAPGLSAIGDTPRRIDYLKKSIDFINMMIDFPRTLGRNPVPVLRIFNSVITQYAVALKNDLKAYPKARAMQALFEKRFFDRTEFVKFFEGLTHEGRRIYSEEEIRGFERQRDAALGDHRKHLDNLERQTSNVAPRKKPRPLSLPYYIALLRGAENPERFIRPGYRIEMIAVLPVLLTGSFWVAPILAGYAALHAFVWFATEIKNPTSNQSRSQLAWTAAGLMLWHLAAFLPYIFLGVYAAQPAASQFTVVAGWFAAAIWHILFDETQSRQKTNPLTRSGFFLNLGLLLGAGSLALVWILRPELPAVTGAISGVLMLLLSSLGQSPTGEGGEDRDDYAMIKALLSQEGVPSPEDRFGDKIWQNVAVTSDGKQLSIFESLNPHGNFGIAFVVMVEGSSRHRHIVLKPNEVNDDFNPYREILKSALKNAAGVAQHQQTVEAARRQQEEEAAQRLAERKKLWEQTDEYRQRVDNIAKLRRDNASIPSLSKDGVSLAEFLRMLTVAYESFPEDIRYRKDF